MPSTRPLRIAGCSGSASDRREALQFLASHHETDPLDVIIGDWMSEANMASRGVGRVQNPDVPAYEPSFLEALKPALSDLAKHRIKLAVNAGASDTKKLHKTVEDVVKEQGLDLKIAWIEGDEVMDVVKKAQQAGDSEFVNVYTGERLTDWNFEPLYAQAYLGGMGIAAAFEQGADIVLCGRVSDASPVIGAASWWHGWNQSHQDCLANALVTGHLIECSSYATGGNFTGFKEFEHISGGWTQIGYPIAEISSNGEVIITKSKGTGGVMTTDSCTSQLVYEIQGPWYFNSDVTAVLNDISFSQVGPDRVALHGIKSSPPPATTKVGITAKGGYHAEIFWYLTGLDIPAKARMVESQVRQRLNPHVHNLTHLSFTLLGSSPPNPRSQSSSTCTLRIAAQALTYDALAPSKFARCIIDLIMCSYPGATFHLDLRMSLPRPIYEYYVTSIPQSSLTQLVHLPFLSADSTPLTISAPDPSSCKTYGPQPTTTTSPPLPGAKGGTTDAAGGWAELPAAMGRHVLRETFGAWGATVPGPLGLLAHARSGDKGPDANVGFFIPATLAAPASSPDAADQAYAWLRALLTTRRLKELLGDEYVPGNAVERFEMPGLRAVHFLLKRHLDRGVAATAGVDFLGKNVAEFLRARWVDLPVRFLTGEQRAWLQLDGRRAML